MKKNISTTQQMNSKIIDLLQLAGLFKRVSGHLTNGVWLSFGRQGLVSTRSAFPYLCKGTVICTKY